MNLVCQQDMCTGCGACVQICQHKAISIQDTFRSLNAYIDPERCVGCGLCEKTCQQNTSSVLLQPKNWYQGWSNVPEIRENSSSGGAASAIIRAFIRNNGEVCSCAFNKGRFEFRFAKNEQDANAFAGSKYVKSNTSMVYSEVRDKLRQGKKVLFVGLPCQVAGLLKFVSKKEQEKLYTIDLICHGTPSSKILERYLKDRNINISELSDIKFRVKSKINLLPDYKPVGYPGVIDRYSFSFLKQAIYTENCYHCKFASSKRVSDITLGDSWGSDLEKELKNGISLILCQSSKGEELIAQSDLTLLPVDIENAVSHNSQLREAAKKNDLREKFLSLLEKGIKYDRAVFLCYPSIMIRQDIRSIVSRLGLGG